MNAKKLNAKMSVKKTTPKITREHTHRISARKRRQMRVLERHRRLCLVCHHPERTVIEEEFLHWHGPSELARRYRLADYRTIYRHARATGLLLKRRENLHAALDCIVEWSEDVKPSADAILRAMRAYSCIDRHGRWTELPTQVHFVTSRAAGRVKSAVGPKVIDVDPDDLDDEFKDEDSDADAEADEEFEDEDMSQDDEPDEAMEENEADEDAEPDVAEENVEPGEANENAEAHEEEVGAALQQNSTLQRDVTACAASPAQPTQPPQTPPPPAPEQSPHYARIVLDTVYPPRGRNSG